MDFTILNLEALYLKDGADSGVKSMCTRIAEPRPGDEAGEKQ